MRAVSIALQNHWESFVDGLIRWEHRVIELYRNATDRQRIAIIGVSTVTLIGMLTLLVMLVNSAPKPTPQVALTGQNRLEKQQAHSGVGAQPPVDSKVQLHLDTKVLTPPVAGSEKIKPESKIAKSVSTPDKLVEGVKQNSRVRTLEETAGAPAVVKLVIKPWGDVYLDGRKQGASPPLLELQVTAGKHELKIINQPFPPEILTFQVESGENKKITYEFPKKLTHELTK
jgi:hypothetical protein